MFSIQMRSSFEKNEELTTIRILSSICHTQHTSISMGDFEVFVIEFFPKDTQSSCSIMFSEISTLNHESFNKSMERRTFIMKILFLSIDLLDFSFTQSHEVINSFRNYIFE